MESARESAEAEKVAVASVEAALTEAIPAVAEGLPAMHRGRLHFPHRLAILLMLLCTCIVAAVNVAPPPDCRNTRSSSTECLQPHGSLLVARPRRSADLDKGPGRECSPGQVCVDKLSQDGSPWRDQGFPLLKPALDISRYIVMTGLIMLANNYQLEL